MAKIKSSKTARQGRREERGQSRTQSTSGHLEQSPQDRLLTLQRTAGNSAVNQWLQEKASGDSSSESPVQQKAGERAAASTENANALPSVVQSAVNGGGGSPLDPQTSAQMESRFGYDLSEVRVHTDEHAAESALMIGARAYTVGRDIVFGAGEYAPKTDEGQRLMAHEITHVVQQETGAVPAASGIRQPNDAYEQMADQQSAHVAQRAPLAESSPATGPAPLPARASQTVQRTILGGIIGGVLGAIGGAVVGALTGGIAGAIIGGIGGFVGGALIGDAISSRGRDLTPDERKYAHDIYLESIDYDAITITKASMMTIGAPARTIGNTIHMEAGYFKPDTMTLTEDGMLTLIHEMGHVWQYQNGGLEYIVSSLGAQITMGRNEAYVWQKAYADNIPWEEWNAEQQAQAIEDYNKALRKTKEKDEYPERLEDIHTIAILQPFIDKVRNREGAPGSKRSGESTSSSEPSPF
ncbi:MAG: DUF4157 domain-containing protein [Pyrinomonadaceae bacterium]